MTPDRGYQRSVRRLRVCCWVVALCTFGLSLLTLADDYPFAGVLLAVIALGALRIADEVREEIEGWTVAAANHGFVVVCTSGTRPARPRLGSLVEETDTGCRMAYDGKRWIPVAGQTVRVALGRALIGPQR